MIEKYKEEAAALKKEISHIILAAVNGSEPRYRYEGKYIRWGLVEKDINNAIDLMVKPHD